MRGEVGGQTVWASLGNTLTDRDFVRFTGLLLGFYFLSSQLTITVPLLTARLVGAEAIGPLFALQAAVAMVLQVPLVRWANTRIQPLMQVSAAMLLMGCGFVGYALATYFVHLAVATALVRAGLPIREAPGRTTRAPPLRPPLSPRRLSCARARSGCA